MILQKNPLIRLHSLFTIEYRAMWLVALIGLSLSFAAVWLIRDQLQVNKQLEFEWVAHNRVRALTHGIENGLLAVSNVRDFIASGGGAGANEFQQFAGSQLEKHNELHALMWIPVPSLTEGAAVENGESYILSGMGGPYYPVTTIDLNNPDSLPLENRYLEDFYSLLERARDSDKMAASGRIGIRNEQSHVVHGFMAALPVYRSEQAGAQGGLQGFALGLFRLDDLISASVALLEPRGVEILLLDDSAKPDRRFLHFYQSRLSPLEIGKRGYTDWMAQDTSPKLEEVVAVVDRNWSIVCRQTDQFRTAEALQHSPWVALLTGLLFTALLLFYLDRQRKNAHQRQLMESKLKEREELFRQMTETVDEAFWATNADGSKLLYLSPAYQHITGDDGSVSRHSLLDAIYPEDRTLLQQALQQISRDGSDVEVVYRIYRTDGSIRWIRTRGFAVLDEAGRVARMVGFSEDITERRLADEALRASESKLRDLFQQSPDIIMTVDKAGKILLMNRSIPALPAARAVGRSSLALMPHEFRKWYRRALKAVFSEGVNRSFQYSTDEGIYWEGRIVPIRSDGPVSAAMVIASDVTEKRNLEQQTLRNARLASIGVLSAGVAHEINNPNNAIQFNASLLARVWQDATPILAEYLSENGDFALGGLPYTEVQAILPKLLSDIGGNSDRIRRIVLNLKHMARQDAGEHSQRVDIQQVLETSMMILHNQVQKHTDTCVVSIPEDLPGVMGNSQQLEQVFINILFNALQSLPDRTHGVYVTARYRADDECVDIEVQDEGCGVSERDMGRLTEPFYTTRTETGGTGLGLSISRSIMEKHRGRLLFDSKMGEGTRVTMRLSCVGPLQEAGT